jgi:hypothetical protein
MLSMTSTFSPEALTKSQDLAGKRLGALTGGLGLGNLGL